MNKFISKYKSNLFKNWRVNNNLLGLFLIDLDERLEYGSSRSLHGRKFDKSLRRFVFFSILDERSSILGIIKAEQNIFVFNQIEVFFVCVEQVGNFILSDFVDGEVGGLDFS